MNNINEQVIHEVCVSCNTVTEVLTMEPVTTRNHYVEGAGQLCKNCYNQIYS
jgi:hypothetical protein